MVQPGDFWASRSLFGLWISTMHHCTRWRHQTVSQEKLFSRWLVSITHLDPKLSRSVYNASVQPKQLFPLKWYHTTILVHCLVEIFFGEVWMLHWTTKSGGTNFCRDMVIIHRTLDQGGPPIISLSYGLRPYGLPSILQKYSWERTISLYFI